MANNFQYYLFKLKFITPVHFGDHKDFMTCHSDTLFSAVCHEILSLYGENELARFIDSATRDEIKLSGLMPFCHEDELYIPKPILYFEKSGDFASHTAKKLKNIPYIPVRDLKKYIDFLKNGGDFPFDESIDNFGTTLIHEKVAINPGDEPMPYFIGTFSFFEKAGLYFVLGLSDNTYLEKFKTVLKSLMYSGLGGKRSSGYGKFKPYEKAIDMAECEDKESVKILNSLILCNNADYYMLLSLLAPLEHEIESIDFEDSFYSHVERKGFIESETYSKTPEKRKPFAMLGPGSCFKSKLNGSIKDVSISGNHPVYRYGKGIYLGINL